MKKISTYVLTVIMMSIATSLSYAQMDWVIKRAKDTLNQKLEKKNERQKIEVPPLPQAAPSAKAETVATPVPKMDQRSEMEAKLGTIYFSNRPFANGVEGAKTSFSSHEFIYGRLVLNGGTVREILKPSPPDNKVAAHYFRFKLVDAERGREQLEFWANYAAVLTEEDLNKTYWDFDVFPSPDQASFRTAYPAVPENGNVGVLSIYTSIVNQPVAEGTYKLGIDVEVIERDYRGAPKPPSSWRTISGDFFFTFSGKDFHTIKTNYEKLLQAQKEAAKREALASQELPKEWERQTNPLLPGMTAARIQALYLGRFTDKQNLRIVKLHASPAGQTMWTVVPNNLGIPRYRYANQWYTIFVKNTATNECFFQGFGIEQQYQGAGTFGQSFVKYRDSPSAFKCEKMNTR